MTPSLPLFLAPNLAIRSMSRASIQMPMLMIGAQDLLKVGSGEGGRNSSTEDQLAHNTLGVQPHLRCARRCGGWRTNAFWWGAAIAKAIIRGRTGSRDVNIEEMFAAAPRCRMAICRPNARCAPSFFKGVRVTEAGRQSHRAPQI